MAEEEQNPDSEEFTIKNDSVRLKFKAAGSIVNDVLKLLCAEAKVGKTPLELCELGDNTINEMTSKVYNKQDRGPDKVNRGIAFPTSVNVNEICCHYSPLPEGQVPLKVGDIVKIDVGVHIDGYPAVGAHTVVVQDEDKPIVGRVADLVEAAQLMLEVGSRSMKPGKKNNDIPLLWETIAESFKVTVCEGVLSHQMKRFILDGNQSIIAKSSVERRVDDVTFESGQVWTLDVVLSSGKGKLAEGDARCCIYKRNPDQQYMLKLKASKEAFREITTRFQTFPFTIRALDSKSGRLGVNECLKHELVVPYPVLYEKPGEDVVHFKRTFFVANSIEVATGLDPLQQFISDKKCEDKTILEVMKTSLVKKKKKPKKSGKKDGKDEDGKGEEEGEDADEQ